ncbi:MAG: nucleoside-diphosphate kinase [Clostridia bacterium]|jgi:nucleoside-diphosphate kinase|nr:nucleoside diphosphate kinase [Clostridiales bacterium]MDK2985352.1 nucleoside-diphosphate kinase [Clostridia bacterium]
MEKTFVMIKPDGVQRGLVGEIISRFEKKGFKIVAMKFLQMNAETAAVHYAEHEGKPFYDGLVDFITSGPVVAMVLEGKNVVAQVRKMVGKTNPGEAEVGTIRGDFGLEVGRNVVHASDSVESAEREMKIYFEENELLEYNKDNEKWLYE